MHLFSQFLCFLIVSSLFFTISSSSSSTTKISNNGTTAYDILAEFGLPIGLLPEGVIDYSLDEDGGFEVELEKPCYVHFDYLVYYDRKITGTLKIGSITDLDGIEVKKLFLWLNVDEIKVDLPSSDNIYFQVGWINKKLDIDQFQTIHACKDKVVVEPDLLKVPVPLTEISTLVTE